MSLGQHQQAFALDLQKLMTRIHAGGLHIRIGEVWRPQEMQEIYVRTGRSKTRSSMHLQKCAADLFIFTPEGVAATTNMIAPYGAYWESLNILNRWGGSWRGLVQSGASSFVDAPHFERKV